MLDSFSTLAEERWLCASALAVNAATAITLEMAANPKPRRMAHILYDASIRSSKA
jgi:hypothetical protein